MTGPGLTVLQVRGILDAAPGTIYKAGEDAQITAALTEMKLEDFRPNGIVCHRCRADFCEVDGHHCPVPINAGLGEEGGE